MTKDSKSGCGPKWGWARKGPAAAPGFGPPWAKFGPFAGFGPPGMRGPRMFAQGDLRLLLLALIADKPSHGYDLIRTIESRFGGSYTPSPGVVYPTLTLLEEQDLITASESAGSKKSYSATAKGLQHLEENAEQVKALMRRIDIMAGEKSEGPMPASVLHAIGTLRQAIFSKFGNWSSAEEARVRTILENAARDIVSGASRKPGADDTPSGQ